MVRNPLVILIVIVLCSTIYSQNHKILESTPEKIVIEFDNKSAYTLVDTVIGGIKFSYLKGKVFGIRNPGDPWLPDYTIQLGIPFDSNPKIKIISIDQSKIQNTLILPTPLNDPEFEKVDPYAVNDSIYSSNKYFPLEPVVFYNNYVMRYAKIQPVSFSPFQYNPITRELVKNNKIVVEILYNQNGYTAVHLNDGMTNEYLKEVVVNEEQAKNWLYQSTTIKKSLADSSWYDPTKNYFKIYLKNKGIYRLTFDQLISSGVQLGTGVESSKLQIYCNGKSIPIDVFDGNDGVFQSGDYLQFVGYPPISSAYAKQNIFNLTNVYWFTYQENGELNRYKYVDGFPKNYNLTLQSTLETIHYEKDSLYERLGYAGDGNRDHWFWGKATAQSGAATWEFQDHFLTFPNWYADSTYITLRVDMHGMTNIASCTFDHKANIFITDQLIGSKIWDGQQRAIFEKKFYASSDSIKIYPTGNVLKVQVKGDICASVKNDEIRINWYEFDYWRLNRTNGNNFIFTNPVNYNGVVRFWTWLWDRDNMFVYVPGKNKKITNVQISSDANHSAFFIDTVSYSTDYFCASSDFYLTPDSIIQDEPSNLRNTSNGADYIIITHKDFKVIADRLKELRELDFPDNSIANPRINVVDVDQIYDEFSNGLLDPEALKLFVKYVFENWQNPAPTYIVLLGDMSYDYRGLLKSSRKNFIPSIEYFANTYGIAASDNMIVTVAGSDIIPDLSIGRLSIEAVDEGNVLIDKLSNYPSDASKNWKQNVLLIASGVSLEDELFFGFNEASQSLENNYIAPNGYSTSKVFRYPNPNIPDQELYQGEGPKIREKFNEGAVLANYYGHGGGYQWDLVFTNDDIYQLENGGRLPFIISVTCYTAHFDNQNVFGEQFNKVADKGSIGFFGSSGLTYWQVGKEINQQIFRQIFDNRNFIIGKVIKYAKSVFASSSYYNDQIALLTLLSDPILKLALPDKPDFVVTSSNIRLSKKSPLVKDTISVTLTIHNSGPIFSPDSVRVELFATSADSTFKINSTKIGSFAEKDSVIFNWIPLSSGTYQLTVKVNENEPIPEDDLTDNTASSDFYVFNISEPSVVTPIDGFTSTSGKIDFLIVDIGEYINSELIYEIEIDTSLSFDQPIVKSSNLYASDGVVKWTSPELSSGTYFWRTKIFNNESYGNWSDTRTFKISSISKPGYFVDENALLMYNNNNVYYDATSQGLMLSTELKPPRPSNTTLLNTMEISPSLPDSVKLNTITTDGTYIYAATIWYYALNYNSVGYSRIYRFGTGNNSTIAGQYYGAFSNYFGKVYNSIFYLPDGHIYVYEGNKNSFVRINTTTEIMDTIIIPGSVLKWENAREENGPAYLSTDGQYVFNLTRYDTLGANKYILRIFDPQNEWEVIEPYRKISGTSYSGFSGFFAAKDYIFPAEYYSSNYIRRIKTSDGTFEDEWIAYKPFLSLFSWCYDWINDEVYSGAFRSTGYTSKFLKFSGKYLDATGTITSTSIGPASKWNSIEYVMDTEGATGNYNAVLQGFNKNTSKWDTLITSLPAQLIPSINTDTYKFIRLSFMLVDSSFGETKPIELKSVHVDYTPLPEIMISKDNISFSPDSILQGYDVIVNTGIQNISSIDADSVQLDYYQKAVDFSSADVFLKSRLLNLEANSQQTFTDTIHTTHLLLNNQIKLVASYPKSDMFSFNNTYQKSFYVKRDSERPIFDITFDGKEIISNDIISSQPTIQITLEDNSPLPLNPNDISITHFFDNVQEVIKIPSANTTFEYTPYPNSKAIVTWKPAFEDGNHTLIVTAKDSSNNYFDSTSYNIDFNVYSNPDLRDVYNYPNPFSNNTYFTFEIRGITPPEEFKIKIFTIAGRLIKEFNISQSELRIGFNKIPWDGRDEDGDEIANGLYFYKVISKQNNEVMTVTQKLAKVK